MPLELSKYDSVFSKVINTPLEERLEKLAEPSSEIVVGGCGSTKQGSANFFAPNPHAGDRPTHLSAMSIKSAMDDLENNFAKSALAIVSNQADAMVKKLKNAKIEEIKKAGWSVTAPLQQLLYSFWREGWDLGQKHGSNFSSIAKFSESDRLIQADVTIQKKDRRIKASKELGNQAAYISDSGIPLQQSGLQQALSDRTLKLASDLDKTTQQEIKAALIARATPQAKTGKPISNQELEARINLALGRQKARTGEDVKTKIPKIGGGFFSRAKLIARTEMTAAYATSSLAAYQAAGTTHVRWLSLEDLQRCPKCTSRHGMVVALTDVETLATNPIPLHPNCFPAGTQILMSDGKTKKIENIRSQDRVYTATAARVQSVYNTFKSKFSGFLVKFTLEDGRTIESTPEHPFWNGSCFVAASTIQTGQSLWLSAYLEERLEKLAEPCLVDPQLPTTISDEGSANFFAPNPVGGNLSSSFNLLVSDSRNSSWSFSKQDWYAKEPINQSTQDNNSFNREKEVWHTPESFQGLAPLRVIKIEQIPFEGFVYNFSVENDEVYVANGILVHNCRCTWQPVPNGEDGDKLRKDPGRNPSSMALVGVAASWIAGKAAHTAMKVTIANAQTEAETIKQKKEQQQKFLGKLIVGSGLGALSLAALYFLVLKSQPTKDSIANIPKTIVDRVDNALGSAVEENARKAISAAQNQNVNSQVNAPNPQTISTNTPQNVLSDATLKSFPTLAQSQVNLKNISLKELMRLTELPLDKAKTFKEEILEWLRQKAIAEREASKSTQPQNILAPSKSFLTIQDLGINKALIPQLQQIFGLSKIDASSVRAYIEKGGSIESVEDLRRVPGIGDRKIARVAARMSQYRPNINAVPNTIAAVNELSAQLNIGPKIIQAILDERDDSGHFQDVADLTNRVQARLKNLPAERGRLYLGKKSLQSIAENADVISLQQTPNQNIQQVRVGSQPSVKGSVPPQISGATSGGESKKQSIQQVEPPSQSTVESSQKLDPLTPSIIQPKISPSASQSRIAPNLNNTPSVSPPKTKSSLKPEKNTTTPLPSALGREPAKQKFTSLDSEYERLANEVDNYHDYVRGSIPPKLRTRQKNVEGRANRALYEANQSYTNLTQAASQLTSASNKIEADIESLEKSYGQFLNPVNEPYFDNAPAAIKKADKAISQSISLAESQSVKHSRSIEEINNRIRELQILQQDVTASVNRPNLANNRNVISAKLDDLNSRVSGLDSSPQTNELQRQIKVLQSELVLERDRQIENINRRIAELQQLSTSIQQDAEGTRTQINKAKAKLQELRTRLSKLPKSPQQLSEAAQARYTQVRNEQRNQRSIRSQVEAYREATQQHSRSVDDIANNQLKAIADYEIQSRSAVNNLNTIAQNLQSRIDHDMQLLRLMSGREGVNWVLEQVQTGTEAGLILQKIGRNSGVRSINTIEQAAKFREYAMSALHGRVLGQSQLLQERLEYPTALTQKFLDEANATATDLKELQKSIVIKHQDDSNTLINNLHDWEENFTSQTPGGGVRVNPDIRTAKNQIINEIANTHKSNAQNVGQVIADQESWKSALSKKLNEELVLEVDGKTVTRTQLLEQLKLADDEANRLRGLRQVEVTPIKTTESEIKEKNTIANRAKISEMRSQISDLRSELGKVTLEINKRLEAKSQGRKYSPTAKLEAEANGLQKQINNLIVEIDKLTQNGNFKLHGNNTEVYFQFHPCRRDRKKIIYPTSRLPRSEFAMPNLKRTSLGLL